MHVSATTSFMCAAVLCFSPPGGGYAQTSVTLRSTSCCKSFVPSGEGGTCRAACSSWRDAYRLPYGESGTLSSSLSDLTPSAVALVDAAPDVHFTCCPGSLAGLSGLGPAVAATPTALPLPLTGVLTGALIAALAMPSPSPRLQPA